MTFDLTTNYETYKNCYFIDQKYTIDDSLALEIWNDEDGPIARLTTWVGATSSENAAYVDTNNCPWAEDFIEKMGIGKPTGNFARSGFCIYPEYEFDMDKVNKYMGEEE